MTDDSTSTDDFVPKFPDPVGDCLKAIMEIDGVDKEEAIRILCCRLGMETADRDLRVMLYALSEVPESHAAKRARVKMTSEARAILKGANFGEYSAQVFENDVDLLSEVVSTVARHRKMSGALDAYRWRAAVLPLVIDQVGQWLQLTHREQQIDTDGLQTKFIDEWDMRSNTDAESLVLVALGFAEVSKTEIKRMRDALKAREKRAISE